ncbi:uncharacterized protein LOC115726738 [Rhodamnia argentea]|uniref:Uncharacterized protein LOC115726738 n=1 Tax=Rhodamnia argentea TaxID=178133 RepID=A0ABM3HPH1_9MYRT|nr:uncharacterized protein LOC115726738 [Rhodamnia argentea]
MGGAEGDHEHLARVLNSHLDTIHDTYQVLSQKPSCFLKRVSWEEVVKVGDQVSKQATVVGMLWMGQKPQAKAMEESMTTYFNALQGFLLLSHGSMVGAGPTLSSNIHEMVKKVVDCSFKLLSTSVHYCGSRSDEEQGLSIPVLVGTVWEACSALKKAPATNITAIGRAMSQVAVTMKDVLREMKELKPACLDPSDEASDVSCTKEGETQVEDNSSEGDIGNDLSPEEMKVANAASVVVSDTLTVVKELIRAITGLLKMENSDDGGAFVDSLEKLLKLCQGIGVQIDELGACLYPPQEISAMTVASEKMLTHLNDLQVEVENIKGASEGFIRACDSIRSSLKRFESDLSCSCPDDLESLLQSTTLSD